MNNPTTNVQIPAREPQPFKEQQLLTHAQMQVVQCVTFYEGASLANRGDELRRFIARGVDDPAGILDEHVSDCGLFALAVWHAIDVQDLRLTEKYKLGMAISWLVDIAGLHNAVRHPLHDGVPTVGALMHYATPHKNNDHVEFLLSPAMNVRGQWLADHAGGGRADCAIGSGHSDVRWSLGRPLQAWYDINALLPERDETLDAFAEAAMHEEE